MKRGKPTLNLASSTSCRNRRMLLRRRKSIPRRSVSWARASAGQRSLVCLPADTSLKDGLPNGSQPTRQGQTLQPRSKTATTSYKYLHLRNRVGVVLFQPYEQTKKAEKVQPRLPAGDAGTGRLHPASNQRRAAHRPGQSGGQQAARREAVEA